MVIKRIKWLIGKAGGLRHGRHQDVPVRKKISETSKCRGRLAPYCAGDGVDIGYGGDPIVPHAICMDLPEKYAAYEAYVQQLHGDAADLRWFRDGALDWVYSSHVLEDFTDTLAVLNEWLRVLRIGGRLILFLPDEPLYRSYCSSRGIAPNVHHIHADFGPSYLKRILDKRGGIKLIHEAHPVDVYSFELVIEKVG